ncbi:MAG: prepilin-type N-terminal cleavage/methylation domain-containing protein [Erysipelotrichaceae bacterium]|nr:prepilin-type N-terminal cleavage/methylation domain-containing protein [Erysipelotrichaceae bacterium]
MNKKAFTLAELLIVVAIIAVMVGVSIPVFSNQLEKNREAKDLANIRSAYAKIMVQLANSETVDPIEVELTQKVDYWQFNDEINIGGIEHKLGDPDNDNWKGEPKAKGICTISYLKTGVLFNFGDSLVTYPFDLTENLMDIFNKSAQGTELKNHANFEIDSKCTNPKRVDEVVANMSENSLLRNGTWAFLGNGGNKDLSKQYLYWTSLDTNEVGPNKTIPILVATGDGKFYVSTSKIATRKLDDPQYATYTAIAGHLNHDSSNPALRYDTVINNGTYYANFKDAYKAYVEIVNADYPQYKNTIPK